jgi:hypothetical protein
MMTRTHVLIAHAAKRAGERYGILLDEAEIRLLSNKIMLGDCEIFETEGRRKSKQTLKVFVNTDGGVQIPVIYSPQRKSIITVLPPDAAEVVRAKNKGFGSHA